MIEQPNQAPEPTRGTGPFLLFESRGPRAAQLQSFGKIPGANVAMSYYLDLSPYEYSRRREPDGMNSINVGWLSRAVPFEVGETSPEFRDLLLRFCGDQRIVHIARGFHVCDVCDVSSEDWYRAAESRYGPNAQWLSIGDGEIRIFGAKAIYAAPAMIYHYVVEHGYRPPVEFVEAVLNGPTPESKEYEKLLESWLKRK